MESNVGLNSRERKQIDDDIAVANHSFQLHHYFTHSTIGSKKCQFHCLDTAHNISSVVKQSNLLTIPKTLFFLVVVMNLKHILKVAIVARFKATIGRLVIVTEIIESTLPWLHRMPKRRQYSFSLFNQYKALFQVNISICITLHR